MNRWMRPALLLVGCLMMVPFFFVPANAAPQSPATDWFGKVIAVKDQPTLVTKDGKSYPLLRDDGGKRFFKDVALFNREMRLAGKLDEKTGMLRVFSVHTIKNGTVFEIFYWCDICAIKRHERMICECCNGPMELREEPLGR